MQVIDSKLVSKMTYNVLMGTLNPTNSTQLLHSTDSCSWKQPMWPGIIRSIRHDDKAIYGREAPLCLSAEFAEQPQTSRYISQI